MEVTLIGPGAIYNQESVIAAAGRVCYRSENDKPAGEFISARVRQGHESIIEHSILTFEITGISRACTHQLVRHRLASYSQESQRYVDMSEFEVVVPPSIQASEEASAVFEEFLGDVSVAYEKLRGLGIRKEDARFVLPNATATKIVVTMNFRELRHFCQVRCDKAAQWEIRQLAMEMLRLAYMVAPSVFEDLYKLYC